jgi:hypothetical protein
MELHGGEMSYEGNKQLTLDIIDKSDKEKFSLQTNGLGEREFYEELEKRKNKIERIGFTYHRAMIGNDINLTERFGHNVRAVKGMGINVYVKELLFPERKDAILKNKKFWELQNVEFRIQDFKGEGGYGAPRYTNDDVALIHPEYQHIVGEQCACRVGYKNIIIRGYDAIAYAHGGDVLACWHDPTVIGNINNSWYNPNYAINRLQDNTVDVAVAQKLYRGNYPRDMYMPGYETKYKQYNKYQFKQLKQRSTGMTQERLVQELNKLVAEHEKTATAMRNNEGAQATLREQFSGLVTAQVRAEGAMDKLRELLAAGDGPVAETPAVVEPAATPPELAGKVGVGEAPAVKAA